MKSIPAAAPKDAKQIGAGAPVTRLAQYRAKQTVEVLEELLEQAKAGDLTGLAVVCKRSSKHTFCLTGDYREDPLPVMALAERMQHVLNRMMDRRDASAWESSGMMNL